MTITLQAPDIRELKPRITVFGCGGAGGNAVNNMIEAGLMGCDFVVANTDAQALSTSKAERRIQMGLEVTQGLGAGAQPEVGRAAAEEVIDEIRDQIAGAHMLFITGGMGGGTGTGSSPVVARAARDLGILTVGVVTKPFQFEGARRMRIAEAGIAELQKCVDTLIVIPNQNLFRVANEKTTFADAFAMADQVLYSGVASVTDLMVKEGLINLDFADVRAVMREMGKAMMGTGEATGEGRALAAAEAAISNPLLDETSMRGARGLLISISGGADLTLYEIDEAANRIRQEVDEEANVIFGATRDDGLEGVIRVSVVATGIDQVAGERQPDLEMERRIAQVNDRFAADTRQRQVDPARIAASAPRRFTPVVETQQAVPSYEPVRIEPEAVPQPVYQQPASVEEPVAVQQPAPVQSLPPAPLPHALDPYEAFAQPIAPAPEPLPSDGPFIPPQPERMIRSPRMPRVEELPMPAQRQMQAAPAPQQAPTSPVEAKRMTLLQRLAAVGMGRKEDAPEAATTSAPEAPRAVAAPQPSPVHAEYGRRPPAPQPARAAQGQLDVHGRPQPTNRALDDDHLEIPAFLRRQAN